MTTTSIGASIAIGFVHGFVVWRLMLRMVGPVARLSQGRQALKLPITAAVTYVVVLLFLIAVAFLLLIGLGSSSTGFPTRSAIAYRFIGSQLGLYLSGILPRVESRLRRRGNKHEPNTRSRKRHS
jgi:protein-S-isoprenylcysteine O-methyltransferase Ste14